MKASLVISLLLLAASPVLAAGPWAEYAETPPPAGSPAALTGVYVVEANQRNFTACRNYMTPEYEEWLELIGGVETSLSSFVNADLSKRFAWRQSIAGNTATVWIRVYVITKSREVNIALNLVNTSSGWKLTK